MTGTAAAHPPADGTSAISAEDCRAIAGIMAFWRAAGRERWFGKDAEFDRAFADLSLDFHWAAARRRLDGWAETADGSLALVLLLDQLPRNAFRGTAHMFATDPLARLFARWALAAEHDRQVDPDIRPFLYLPFSHAEDAADQAMAVRLMESVGAPWDDHAREHSDIIRRFGRFPHRNVILGRQTTAEERSFLDAGGFAG